MIKFQLKEKSRANKVFLKLEYMSGDADAYEYEEVEIGGVTFENHKNQIIQIEEFVAPYRIISQLTDCNHQNYCKKYKEIKEVYGEEIASLYENVPGDSTCDGQERAHLRSLKLIAFDKECNKYESYL